MIDIINYLEEKDFIINDVDTGSATPIIRTKQIPFNDKILDFSKMAVVIYGPKVNGKSRKMIEKSLSMW